MKLPIGQMVCGDALEVMAGFPDESISCCISSPPYWSLRDYGIEPTIWDGDVNCKHKWKGRKGQAPDNQKAKKLDKEWQSFRSEKYLNQPQFIPSNQSCSLCGAWLGSLGLEPTFELYIKHLCDIYDEVYRILRKDGTCWVNLGDTYAATRWSDKPSSTGISRKCSDIVLQKEINLPDKCLCLIPDRFRIEMINRGWILRNRINWVKPNPMPSSAKDRFTVDFEDVMFFVKNSTTLYWIRPDGKMVDKQPDYKAGIEGLDWQWGIRKKKKVKLSLWQGEDYFFEPQYEPHSESTFKYNPRYGTKNNIRITKQNPDKGFNVKKGDMLSYDTTYLNPLGRNKRTTWIIPTQATPDAHFATFPKRLVQPMIRAGCPQYVCKKCGMPRVKVYDVNYKLTGGKGREKYGDNTPNDGSHCGPQGMKYGRANAQHYFKGYTDCGCNAGFNRGIVLDPFAGIGTACTVAERLDRWWIGIDLSEEYCKMARRKMAAVKRNPGLKVFT